MGVTAETEGYAGPKYCPKGHEVADPSLGFCPVCGETLVDIPAVKTEPEVEIASPKAVEADDDFEEVEEIVEIADDDDFEEVVTRKCRKCGYECDDPALSFCPICGQPFGSATEPPELPKGWVCRNGHKNPESTRFCTVCGSRRGDVGHKTPEPPVSGFTKPKGMEPPTEDDLMRKS